MCVCVCLCVGGCLCVCVCVCVCVFVMLVLTLVIINDQILFLSAVTVPWITSSRSVPSTSSPLDNSLSTWHSKPTAFVTQFLNRSEVKQNKCSAFLYVLLFVILYSVASAIVGYFILLSDALIFCHNGGKFRFKICPIFYRILRSTLSCDSSVGIRFRLLNVWPKNLIMILDMGRGLCLLRNVQNISVTHWAPYSIDIGGSSLRGKTAVA